MEKKIAVRLFENKMLGTTYGKGQYRSAVFNASAEIKDPHTKYLLDFHSYAQWELSANSDQHMAILNDVVGACNANDLVSWVVKYNPATKEKTHVYGVAVLDLNDNKLMLAITDTDSGIEDVWQLPVKSCKQTHEKSPALLATNGELADW